ncbi:C10 family peptidase [Capnocytophaga cynodegmi]|uniref:Peptidase C10 family n=1 Tax=Capnocytophaga cynodegmi TaxID=28189 RepID=A0A0B7HBL2_9FLAO|nr:C10 family peptidase [Capnocytophaga cynodegmi]CEN37071.1 Peptidase C10 family [Capnocytophaga cynodegmi]CEN40662.1 Peptidase C10 family [Capnocytophaga cynodegmi]
MKRKILSFVLATGIFVSCQQEESITSFTNETTTTVLPTETSETVNSDALALVALTGQTHISAKEAQETALFTATQMREVEGIVTKSPLQIASTEVVTADSRKPYVPTKSSEQEQADVYVINFTNNQGYVVTSADRRVPGVLVYNSHGTLGNAPKNPGQAILFEYIEDYINQEREIFEKNKENLKAQAEELIFKQLPKEKQEKLVEQGYFDKNGKRIKTKSSSEGMNFNSHEEYREWFCSVYGVDIAFTSWHPQMNDYRRELENGYNKYGEWRIVKKVSPLLKTLWGQGGEYDNMVSLKCGINEQAPVGCVATAVGQLMAYHKKPAVFKGRTMHWNEMTKIDSGDMFSNIYSFGVSNNPTAKEDIQYLLAKLGDGDLLDMNYGCDGSGASTNNAEDTFKKLGYTNVYQVSYDGRKVVNEITNNRPIYIDGCAQKINHRFLGIRYNTTYESCHAWVIDGYVEMVQPITTFRVMSCYNDALTSYETTSRNTLELVHQNFGWGGSLLGNATRIAGYDGSGWYRLDVFNSRTGRKNASNTYKSDSQGNYKYHNDILINIK